VVVAELDGAGISLGVVVVLEIKLSVVEAGRLNDEMLWLLMSMIDV
jgi:hypothetical protein